MRRASGHVVEASVLARLLRIRLLTLEATVVVAPADVAARSPPAVVVRTQPRPVGALPAADVSGNGRGRLAEAIRTIEEAAATLDEARRIAPTQRRVGKRPRG